MVIREQLKEKFVLSRPKTLPGGTTLIALARRIPHVLERALVAFTRAAPWGARWCRRRSHPPGTTPRQPRCLAAAHHKEFAAQQLGFKCRASSHCQTTV